MAKQSKKELEEYKERKRLLKACICFFISIFIFISLLQVSITGIVGNGIKTVLEECIGNSSYILSVVIFWFAILYLIKNINLRTRLDIIFATISIVFGSILLSLLSIFFKLPVSGGYIGTLLAPCFYEPIGIFSLVIVFFIFIFSFAHFFRISLLKIIKYLITSTINDINQWYNYKKAKKQEKPNIIDKNNKEQDNQEPEQFEQTEKPRIIDSRTIEKVDSDSIKQQIKEVKPQEEKVPKIADKKDVHVEQEKIDTKTFKYTLPPVKLLREGSLNTQINEKELQKRAEDLRETLKSFKIDAIVQDIIPGPVITRYDIVLSPGIKIQSVMNIMDNISLAMKTSAIRIEQVPEKSAVGIEIPNPKPSLVSLRDILDTKSFYESKSLLTLAVGTKTDGSGYISNLAKMPHLLIAGSTGSGKSVGVHNIILSILYKARPDEVKFLLIDPKRVEMIAYKDIPHLYNPCCIADNADVIINPNEAANALKKLVDIMENRYEKYSQESVRNIEEYNAKMELKNEDKDYYIVVIIDELADLMMVSKKEIETPIIRIAQKARAVGIHLVLATQRPTVNVITGLIKSNIPARLSFQTVSAVDSKVILDTIGAESLIGKGDMLFLPPSEPRPVRLQGAFVSTKEIEQVVKFISDQNFPKVYEAPINEVSQSAGLAPEDKNEKDLIPALRLIIERREISQDLLKANFGGSAKATNLLSLLRMRNFIYKPEGKNRWQINYELIEDYLRING